MDDKTLLNRFIALATECRKINHRVPDTMHAAMTSFESAISRATDPQKAWLKDVYGSELTRIKHTISKMANLRSLHDKVFTNHLKYDKSTPLHVTDLFEMFIKGITYFSNESSDVHPIYHRFYSCGPREDTHRLGNLVCTGTLGKTELNRRRNLIERCYIERLIFDKLWGHEALFFPPVGPQEPEQNKGLQLLDFFILKVYQTRGRARDACRPPT